MGRKRKGEGIWGDKQMKEKKKREEKGREKEREKGRKGKGGEKGKREGRKKGGKRRKKEEGKRERGRGAGERGGVVADVGIGPTLGDRGHPRGGYGHRHRDYGRSRAG